MEKEKYLNEGKECEWFSLQHDLICKEKSSREMCCVKSISMFDKTVDKELIKEKV